MTEQINKIAEIWWSWMWPMFWQVGVLIVLIAAVDLFIKRWVWPQVRYALWLLVLVKLVLPPSLTSPASLTSHIPLLAKKAVQSQITLPEKPSQTTPNTTPTEPFRTRQYKDSSDTTQTTIARVVTTEAVDPKPTNITPVPMTLSWRVYGFMVWLLGVVFLSSWLILRLRRLRKENLNDSGEGLPEWFDNLLDQIAQRLKLRRPPEIVLSGKVYSPATFGLFRPVLLMPKDKVANLSKTNAEHILLHELAHIKRGDLFVHGFYMLLQIVYWFNPLIWLIRTRLQSLRELCCDATVAMILKEKTFSYRETLLEIAKQLLTEPVGPGMGFLGLFENSKRLADRLKWLEKKTWKNRPRQLATIIALVGVMLCCVLPMAKATKGEAAVAPGGTVKAVATKPQPHDGTTTGTTVSKLKWKPGVNAKSHKIYFGTQTNQLPLLAEVESPSYDELPELEEGTRYYWLVNEVWADGTVIIGDVWSFTTGKLVGWWKFDGNANDSSGNGNNGTEKGDPTYVAGKIGQAISFDGLGDRIEVHATFAGNPELFPAKAISVLAWIRSTVPASALCSLIRHEFHFTPLQTFANSAWANAFTDQYGSTALRRTSSDWSKINDGKWHYYAVTYNNGIHEVWIDGTKEVSNNFGPFPLWTGDDQPWVFGGKERGEGGGEYYPGELDDVRIYNYALSEKEIEMLSRVKAIKPHPSDDATKGLTEMPEISVSDPNLVGWWKFDGNANDSSGNGNNGTEKGDPTYVAGKIGQAISFDGLGDRIEVHATLAGNPELFPAKAISVLAWVRSTVPASALCSLIRHEFHFTPLQTFAGSAWAIAFTDRYESKVLRRTDFDWSKINDGKWHFYTVTYNNGIHEVWIDGTKEASSKFGPSPLWTGDDQPWVFGGKERGEGGGEYYPGELDDVRIYNYALSKGEITTLYNEGK